MQKRNFGIKQRKKNQMNYKWHLYPVLVSHIPNTTTPKMIINQLLNQIRSSPDSISYLKKCSDGISFVANTEEIYHILLQTHGFIVGGQKLWIFHYPYEFKHSENALKYIFEHNYNESVMDLSDFISKYNTNPDANLPSVSLDDQNFIDFLFYKLALFDNYYENITIKKVILSKNNMRKFNVDRVSTFLPSIDTIDLRENEISNENIIHQNLNVKLLIDPKKILFTGTKTKLGDALKPKPIYTPPQEQQAPKLLGNVISQRLQQANQMGPQKIEKPPFLDNSQSPKVAQPQFQQVQFVQQQFSQTPSSPTSIPPNILLGAQPIIIQANQPQQTFLYSTIPQQQIIGQQAILISPTNQQQQPQNIQVIPNFVFQQQPQMLQVPVQIVSAPIQNHNGYITQNLYNSSSPTISPMAFTQPPIPAMQSSSYNSPAPIQNQFQDNLNASSQRPKQHHHHRPRSNEHRRSHKTTNSPLPEGTIRIPQKNKSEPSLHQLTG